MTRNGKRQGIVVTAVEAENFRRLRFARAEMVPGEGLVRVTGRNGAGKTSLLQMIREGLGGAGEVLPEPVHDGSEDGKGHFRITLSNGFSVERRYTEAAPKGYLTVVGPDGGKHGQGKLAEWLGPLSFDPLAFFQVRSERQREILLSLGRDPQLAAKLDQLRVDRQRKYDERTPWISQKRRAGQVKQPSGERPEPVDVSAEMVRLGELQAHERARGDAAGEIRRYEEAIRRAEDRRGDLDDQAQEIRGQIARLRAKLQELEQEDARIVQQTEAAREEMEKRRVALEALPDPTPEMGAVRSRLSLADAVQRALEPWRAYDRAQEELEEATAAEQALTAVIRDMEAREASLIAEAGIPIPGLSFTDAGAPLLNGRALEIASGAERISLAVSVALAADPELRVCLLDEANDIDLEGLEALDALAREHGFQVWAARLGLEGAGELVVEDGVARGREEQAVAAGQGGLDL